MRQPPLRIRTSPIIEAGGIVAAIPTDDINRQAGGGNFFQPVRYKTRKIGNERDDEAGDAGGNGGTLRQAQAHGVGILPAALAQNFQVGGMQGGKFFPALRVMRGLFG